MPNLKIGIHLPNLGQPLRQALHTAARLGVQGVEIDARSQIRPQELSETGVRELRKLLDDLGLRVAAVSFPTRRGYGCAEDLDARVEATRQAMRMAYALGCTVVVNHVGRIPSEEELSPPPRDENPSPVGPFARQAPAEEEVRKAAQQEWQLLLEVLKDLGRFSERVGARLAAKTGGASAADLARLLAALPEGAIGLDLDPGSMVAQGHEPLAVVQQLGEHILHVRARDAVRDRGLGRGTEVALGRGMVDFPALLAALHERGYRGFYTLQRDLADDAAGEMRLGAEYLRRVAGEI